MNFEVKVEDGEVYINDDFVAQLCWDAEAVGSAVALWLKGYLEGGQNESQTLQNL